MTESAGDLRGSVVIPTYNDAALLRDALTRLVDQTLPADAYEIIVVDDGSTDATPDVVTAAARARVRVRLERFEENRGRSAARNAGIRAAGAPIIVFVDSDILVRRDFVERHLAIHAAAASPVLGRGPVLLIPTREMPPTDPVVRISPAFLATANASIGRQVLFDVGMFDEGFRAYGWEDFDLGLRLQAHGVRRVFDPKALAYHVEPVPAADDLPRYLSKEEERARTALYLLRKHPGRQTRWLIQDTSLQRAVHFVLGGAGWLTPDNAPRLAARLYARGHYTLATLVIRGVLNRHYLASLQRFRATPEHG
jgi:glycosyltransferase involved in cell wall biosynthesis